MYLYVLGFTGPDLWTYDIFFEETISQEDAARKLTCIKERIEKLRELEVAGKKMKVDSQSYLRSSKG